MKAYELLILNKSLLQMMGDASLDVGDVKYIPVYQEYVRLSKEGHKKTYIMQYLSDEYNIAETRKKGCRTVCAAAFRA